MFFKKRLRKATPEDDAKLAQAMEELDKWAGENPTITIICI